MPEADLTRRIGSLTYERRELLSKLLSRQPAEPVDSGAVPQTSAQNGWPFEAAEVLDAKTSCRRFYDCLSAQLDDGMFGEFSFFLNYGYVADLSPQYSAVELPQHYLNHNSAKLVLELIGDCPVNGRRVLDVGCGRGGTAHMLTEFFVPAAVIGLDLSPLAVTFCRQAHRHKSVRFVVGDAEGLPFAASSFDVVSNLESSSCYPDLYAFYREAHRVLAPGGYFLYSDCLPREREAESVRFLTDGWFQLERARDITNNVLLSCDRIAQARLQAYGATENSRELENFLGAPGSQYYQDMREGRWTYRILKLRKEESIS